MTWIIRPILALAICVAVVGVPATARAAAEDYVKYYTVAPSYNGAPENLTEIAVRFLGDGSRSGDIYSLNVGRRQSDGAGLADPTRLHAGWVLVMPWDAIGTGIQYGVLPGSAPAPKPSTPAPKPSATAPATSAGAPSPDAAPSRVPASAPPPSGQCATAAAGTTGPDWARARLAIDKAWPEGRGKGQLVAVLDSGVDAGVPRLNEHVLTGTDVVTAGGRGDVDCLGSGTAMAGLIVGQPDGDGTPVGVAPDAMVLPIRVVGTAPVPAQPGQQAAAIKDAVTAGATVIALGQYVDVTDGQVTAAISDALNKNAVVVVEAPAATGATGGDLPTSDAVLRVGGVDANGRQPQTYRSGAVDVVAPAVGVDSLGIGDTGTVSASGTQLAVAFVAGTVALVRAANPKLDAKQVGQRIRTTASRMGGGPAPDARYGWGMLNPGAAVTSTVAGGSASPAPPRSSGAMAVAGAAGSGGGAGWLLWFLLLPLLGGGFLILRYFLRRGSGPEEEWSGQLPARGPAPAPVRPAPRPVVTPSASAVKAATSLAGVESHWTDAYLESGMIEGDEDPTHHLTEPIDPYGDS